jgi:hypothetical protein
MRLHAQQQRQRAAAPAAGARNLGRVVRCVVDAKARGVF